MNATEQKLLRDLGARADQLAMITRKHMTRYGRQANFGERSFLNNTHENVGFIENGVRVIYNSYAEIDFINIRPRSNEHFECKIYDAVIKSSTPKNASRVVINNNSGLTLKREKVFGESKTTIEETAQEIGAKASLAFKQTIKYGNAAVHGIEGQTDIQASFEASYKHATRSRVEMTTENSSTFNLEVPPYTEVTIDYTMDEVVMQQTTEFTANLDYDIIIHSHGSFIHHFDSTKHMESIFQGLLRNRRSKTAGTLYADFPVEYDYLDAIASPIRSTIQITREYAGATNAQYNIQERSLRDCHEDVDGQNQIVNG